MIGLSVMLAGMVINSKLNELMEKSDKDSFDKEEIKKMFSDAMMVGINELEEKEKNKNQESQK